jgi:hypothetical protein
MNASRRDRAAVADDPAARGLRHHRRPGASRKLRRRRGRASPAPRPRSSPAWPRGRGGAERRQSLVRACSAKRPHQGRRQHLELRLARVVTAQLTGFDPRPAARPSRPRSARRGDQLSDPADRRPLGPQQPVRAADAGGAGRLARDRPASPGHVRAHLAAAPRPVVNIKGGAFTLIDESYNANPVSMQAALKTLGAARWPASGSPC